MSCSSFNICIFFFLKIIFTSIPLLIGDHGQEQTARYCSRDACIMNIEEVEKSFVDIQGERLLTVVAKTAVRLLSKVIIENLTKKFHCEQPNCFFDVRKDLDEVNMLPCSDHLRLLQEYCEFDPEVWLNKMVELTLPLGETESSAFEDMLEEVKFYVNISSKQE